VKADVGLAERVAEKFDAEIDAKTFHGLGNQFLVEILGAKPLLLPLAAGPIGMIRFIRKAVGRLLHLASEESCPLVPEIPHRSKLHLLSIDLSFVIARTYPGWHLDWARFLAAGVTRPEHAPDPFPLAATAFALVRGAELGAASPALVAHSQAVLVPVVGVQPQPRNSS
jgi:hypothetical protein